MYRKHIKRPLDFICALFGLIIISPVMLVVAAFVALSSKGGVFFFQERLGRHGNIFRIIKFRTMIDGAVNKGAGLFFDGENDFRITKVGKFLRSTSLDEFPQLINVIKGDMSLIGARPPVPMFPYNGYDNYPEPAKRRFCERPGMTGLAQISGGVSLTWTERFVYDISYVGNITFWGDVMILFKTMFVFVNRKDKHCYNDSVTSVEHADG